jgi:hypothetical protein
MDEYTVVGTVTLQKVHGKGHKVVVWRYEARFLAHDEKEARKAFYQQHRGDDGLYRISVESAKTKKPVFLSEIGEVIHSAVV